MIYDEENALNLLNDNQAVQKDILAIDIKNLIQSFNSNISSTTQQASGINEGNIKEVLGDPQLALAPNMNKAVNNLDNVIKTVRQYNGAPDQNVLSDLLGSIDPRERFPKRDRTEPVNEEELALRAYFGEDVDDNVLKSLVGLIDTNSDEKYQYDIEFENEGEKYILFTQIGHGDDELLKNTRYFLTDGQGGTKGTSLKGASCSMCASSNAIANLIGMEDFISGMGINDKLDSSNSLNASLIKAFNQSLYEEYQKTHPGKTIDLTKVKGSSTLGENKEVLFQTIASKYQDKIDYKAYQYGTETIPDSVFQKLSEGKATIVARLGKGSGRYTTGSGHFIEINDYKVDEKGNKMVFVLDSGKSYETTRSQANNEKERRTGWVPFEDVFGRLRISSKDNNIFVFSLKGGNNGVAV